MNDKYGMTPQEIRIAIYRANLNQAAIARALKVNPCHVTLIIDGKRHSKRVHAAIAEAIGIDKARIWPHLYMIPGREPKRGRPAKTWHRTAA
ncbi:MAG TPA: hypothetical protein PLU95_03595 [Syntrophales bacterium]|nr:hypothetical protein [Syntrophales bacterium]